jgi:ABC-type polar amino acid transport system ATPase subunit
MIEIRNVSKWYGSTQVLNNCSTQVAKGEVVVVCGPSGSGKSTLIKCVNALEDFQKGEIFVDGISVGAKGVDLPRLRARVGMVFQSFELFPHLSILGNLNLAQEKVLGRSRGLASRPMATNIPDNSPAVSSNAWRFRAPWRWTPLRCCSTSRHLRSIRR